MHRTMTGLALAIGLAAASIVTASAQQYGYGYNNVPSGSYQQSCNNLRMNGSTLSASCTAANGQRVYSSLNVNGCRGDIANNNGHLTCNGNYGYNGNNGYNGNGYNRGDNDNDNDNDNGNNGHHHHHHYNNGNGNGNGYGYGNGRYNGNSGYGYGLPGGSYQQSCNNARMNGSTLYASCTAANGQWINSSINVNNCRGTDIANRNGYLRC